MKIEELKNKRVKLSDRSITAKDEYGKTAGVVTRCERFQKMRPALQFDYMRKFPGIHKEIFLNNLMSRLFVKDGELFFIHDLRPIDFYERYLKGHPGFEAEAEHNKQIEEIAANVSKFAEVIPCYIVD